MATRDEAGRDLLGRVSTELVRTQRKFFGKGPVKAKSYVMDDLLVVVLRGGLTRAEKTLLGFGQEDLVREFRQVFENEMTEQLTGIVQDLTGRKVVTYQSQIMFDPDIVIELFVFDDRMKNDAIEATGEGQRADEAGAESEDTAGSA
jgi:uncharacterized protein YbcI